MEDLRQYLGQKCHIIPLKIDGRIVEILINQYGTQLHIRYIAEGMLFEEMFFLDEVKLYKDL